MRSGTYAIVPKLPYIPGGDAGGVISAIGPDVTEHKLGDRVFVGTALSFDLTGCYAEKVKRKASEVLSLPETLVSRRQRPSCMGNASRLHSLPTSGHKEKAYTSTSAHTPATINTYPPWTRVRLVLLSPAVRLAIKQKADLILRYAWPSHIAGKSHAR